MIQPRCSADNADLVPARGVRVLASRDDKPPSNMDHGYCATPNGKSPAFQKRTMASFTLFSRTRGDATTLLLMAQCIP